MLALAIGFVACKKDKDDDEDPSPYDNITVAQSQEAFVMITSATWWPYCGSWGIPTFEEALNGAGNIDAARVNGVSLDYSGTLAHPMAATLKSEFGIGGPPNLWIEFNNAYNLNPTGWKNAIVARQAETTVSCGVGMAKEISGNTVTLYVKAKFFSTLSGTYNLAVYAVENHVTATQQGMTSDQHYRVLRGEVTADDEFGVQIFSGTSPEEYTNTFTYTPDSGVEINNLQFVAVIYKMENSKPVESPNSNTL